MDNPNRLEINQTSPYKKRYSKIREKGLAYIIIMFFKVIILMPLSYLFSTLFMRNSKFKFDGKEYSYSQRWYNMTWRCERAIEIPIFISIIKKYHGADILEVGNVMSHYMPTYHDIIDKYEVSKSVINQDIMEFQTNSKYQAIITLSTLEHIGVDEEQHRPEKAIDALLKLQNLLSPDGELYFSAPFGYNFALDKYFFENPHIFKRVFLMKRISRWNKWTEEKYPPEKGIRYGHPYPFANVVLFGVIDAKANLQSPFRISNHQ